MDQLIQFFYEGNKPIRSVLVNDDPWFVAKDVCDVLDIANSRDAVGRLDDDERGVVSTDTLGGNQEMQAVNESGLYSLVLGSRKPEAKAFKRWITHEVIPSIRRHGAYQMRRKTPSFSYGDIRRSPLGECFYSFCFPYFLSNNSTASSNSLDLGIRVSLCNSSNAS